jgi:hypothetical protein
MYLQFTYGWNPLMGSIGALSDTLQKQADGRIIKKMSGKGIFSDEYTTITSVLPYSIGLLANATIKVNVKTNFTYEVWYGGILKEDRVNHTGQRAFGLLASDIIPSLYELVTFSFILDYISNLGDFIGNLRRSQDLLVSTSLYKSEKLVISQSIDGNGVFSIAPSPYKRTITGSVSLVKPYEYMYFNRTPLGVTDTLVGFNFKDPTSGQIRNMLSLSLGMLFGLKGKVLRF